MKKIPIKTLSAMYAGLIGLGMVSTASAALLGRLPATPGGTNYQAYYDNVANLTWLADANYAKTSGYAAANANWLSGSSTTTNTITAGGWMGWAAANTWAANLTVDGVGGWRLPTTLEPDASCSNVYKTDGSLSYQTGCTGSEMGNLYSNVLGGVAKDDLTTTHNANYNLFSNVNVSNVNVGVDGFDLFWSATEYAPDTTNTAWLFLMSVDLQSVGDKAYGLAAWAVHSGDVSAVPVPAAGWLFGSGLFGLIGVVRRKHANA